MPKDISIIWSGVHTIWPSVTCRKCGKTLRMNETYEYFVRKPNQRVGGGRFYICPSCNKELLKQNSQKKQTT